MAQIRAKRKERELIMPANYLELLEAAQKMLKGMDDKNADAKSQAKIFSEKANALEPKIIAIREFCKLAQEEHDKEKQDARDHSHE